MRASLSVLLIGFLSLTVSCAHKAPVQETAQAEETSEVKKDDAVNEERKDDSLAYTCLVGKDARTVVIDKKEKRCEVHYTKFGDQKQVAWAEATPSLCGDVFGKIRSNIEGSGFKCVEGANVNFEEEKKPVETADNN